jgi:hypothetical protein
MTIPGVLLAIAFLLCLAVMAYAAREKLIEQPLSKARARRSPIAEFVDDLQQHRWIVIVGLALFVAVDKSFGFSRGWLQSPLVMAVVITVIFVGRLLLRRLADSPELQTGSTRQE